MQTIKEILPSQLSTSTRPGSLELVPSKPSFPQVQAPRLSQAKFERGIEVIGILLPDLIDSAEKIEALYFCLGDLSDDEFGRGVKILALTHKEFYPKTNIVALLRDYALGDEMKTGVEAWGEVQRALMEMGRTKIIPYPNVEGMGREDQQRVIDEFERERRKPPTFVLEDPIAERIAKAMGIKHLRHSQNEDMDRAHFIRAYEQLRAAEARRRIAGGVPL